MLARTIVTDNADPLPSSRLLSPQKEELSMYRHSHGLPGAVAGVLAVGFTVAAVLLLLQLADIGSATTATGAPVYAALAELAPYPGPTATPTYHDPT